MRSNPKGVHFERWRHVHGCGRWFNVARDTVSDQILEVYAMGESRPQIAAPRAAARTGARRDLTVVASGTDETP
jgi:sarcosine oxidase subunit delta